MKNYPSICILGAGISGITMMKALRERGIAYTTFEKSDQLGGNWVFRNKNGMSSAYRSLHIDSSRYSIEFDDFPFPQGYPDFPHHTQILAYFRAYADKFGVASGIRFNTGVKRAERLPDGTWRITLENGEVHQFDLLVVANGHHWDARWPEPHFPGHFNGVQMHSHEYIDSFAPHDLHGKHVLVVGVGNSAMDISCELSHRGVAARLVVSTRRGAYVIPKYLYGRPLDALIRTTPWLPLLPQRLFGSLLIRLAVGRMENYGLPKPKHRIWQTHPTVSSEFLFRAGSGDITVKPNIARLDGDAVHFEDGTREPFDAIIYATGYKISFPFFDPAFLAPQDNSFPLFKRAFKPGIPNLIFVGFAQAVPSIIKFVEIQTRWLAAYVDGEYALPPEHEMQRIMARDQRAANAGFVTTKRHTMQVDTNLYQWDLNKEWKRGAKRARALGGALPVEHGAIGVSAVAPAGGRAMNIVVTGAAGGIGCRLVTHLARAGHAVVATDIDLAKLRHSAAECYWPADMVVTAHQDVASPRAWSELAAFVAQKFGSWDALVNVAGVLRVEPVHELKPESVALQLDVNTKGVLLGTQAAAEVMVRQGRGHIINMASMAALAPIPGIAVYSASKFAVRGFSLAAAQELEPHGVRVSVVYPDAVDTPMVDYQLDHAAAALTFSGSKILTSDEVAKAIVGLLTKPCAELVIPWSRGFLARISNIMPRFLHRRLIKRLTRKGLSKQEAMRGKRT